jgi:hypothetical protein
MIMAPKKHSEIAVECPCCGAHLTVDPELKKILSFDPPPQKRSALDLGQAASLLKEQAERREALFNQSSLDVRNQSELLERKFAAALEKSKDQPLEKPTRDIDLD